MSMAGASHATAFCKRSYEIPWWSTQQVYTEASLRWLDIPYVVCYY